MEEVVIKNQYDSMSASGPIILAPSVDELSENLRLKIKELEDIKNTTIYIVFQTLFDGCCNEMSSKDVIGVFFTQLEAETIRNYNNMVNNHLGDYTVEGPFQLGKVV